MCCQLPDGTGGGDTDERGVQTEAPPVVTEPTRQPPIPGDIKGPSVPTISGGNGCGRRRFAGEGSNIDNSLRITGLLGYPGENYVYN